MLRLTAQIAAAGLVLAAAVACQTDPGARPPGTTASGAGANPASGGSAGAGPGAASGPGGSGGSAPTQSDPLSQPEPDPNSVPFECRANVPARGPRRIVRLNAAQFGPSLNAVCKALNVSTPAGVAPPFDYVNVADRFSTFSRSYGMNDAELQSAWDMASYAADALAKALIKDKPCLTDKSALPACFTGIAKQAAEAAYRRPLAPEQLASLSDVALSHLTELGTEAALGTLMQAILLSPEFLFRSEVGAASAESGGESVLLTAAEQAAAVSFTLQNQPPDPALVAAAARGPSELSKEVLARLASLADVPSVPQMIREYFRYPLAINIFKDPAVLPDVHRVDLVKDTDTLVSKLLGTAGHQQLFRALLTSQDVWVSQDTYKWYGITQETATHTKQLRTPPAGTRLGLLTQPSFLIHYSDTTQTKPVQRGRFVLESLLCTTVPEVPIGVVPALPDLGENATQRERLSAHDKPTCLACHRLMDPLGLAFEQFDEYGRFRADQRGKALDLAGMVSGIDSGDLTFATALELIGKLAQSEAAEQCFVRHSFRFFMGRNERDADGCALVAARDQYRASGGDYAALIASLFASEPFVTRSISEEGRPP